MIHYVFDKTLPKNLPLLLKKRAEEHPDIKLQAYKNAAGEFEYSSYSRVYNEVICLAAALLKLGVKKGSNVALISDNRREWLLTDQAHIQKRALFPGPATALSIPQTGPVSNQYSPS